MNEFTKLRKIHMDTRIEKPFPLLFLESFEKSKTINPEDFIVIEQFKMIFQLEEKEQLNQREMFLLLSYLGKNEYINAYVVSLFIKNKSFFIQSEFAEKFIRKLIETNYDDSILYALLDTSIENNHPLIKEDLLFKILREEKINHDSFSLILDYIRHFLIDTAEEEILNWLIIEYPLPIKLQLIDLYIELYSMKQLKEAILNHDDFLQEDVELINHYIELIEKQNQNLTKEFTVLQSMFYGDFEDSGKGNNGGLAIFLKSLGTELSKTAEIERVITLTIADDWATDRSLVTYYADKHIFITLPLYVNKSIATEFLKKQHYIKRTIHRFLKRLAINPDIYHVRFLDNASKAVVTLALEQEKKVVLTLTPDPHRNMTDAKGDFNKFTCQEFIERLNKIIIGEELIDASDKIVGIGNQLVKKELEEYFPQISKEKIQSKIHMISEGIQTDIQLMKKEEKEITDEELNEMGLTKEFLKHPIILNVGRLNKLKAQDQLVKAWGNSTLPADYNLLIIGGDLENPSTEEKEMIVSFEKYLNKNSHLKEKFLHLGSLSNYQIRKLEQKIRAKQKEYPQIYLCSSKKEEFGIAILEALSQDFLVLGPKKGGVKSYLENNVNGFLIDTSDWQTIMKDTEKVLASLKNKKDRFEQIQNAGVKTVRERFSMATIAADFSNLYLSLQEKE